MKKLFVLTLILAAATPLYAQANSGDFSGGVAIGTGYAGVSAAPTNGMIIQGSVGIGTTSPAYTLDVNGTLNASSLTLNRVAVPLVPSGRLTLSSTTPVMTADSINTTTIYYLPYAGQNIAVYNGTQWAEQDIGSSGTSLTLSSADMPASEVFDVYASIQSGSLELCALYWGSNTSRSSTSGGKSGSQDARVMQLNGIWVNKTAIATSNCYNNTTSYTIGANQGTLLGSFYTTAAGQTGVQCQPANAAGGPTGASYIDVFNAYNRVPITCEEQDQSTWTYTTASYRQADNSTKNQINFLDGLQQIGVYGTYTVQTANGTAGDECVTGVDLDTTSSPGKQPGIMTAPTSVAGDNFQTVTANSYWYPQLGYHYIAPVEYAINGTCYYNSFGNASQTGMILALPWQF